MSRSLSSYMRERLAEPPSADTEVRLTASEKWTILRRIGKEAVGQLSVGPLHILGAGVGSIFGIGLLEAVSHLESLSSRNLQQQRRQVYFCARYAVAQMLPSLIWHTQPAISIAQICNLRIKALANPLSVTKQLRIANLQALRGAIAGSVVLTQVLSFSRVLQDAKQQYCTQVRQGREPPLDADSSMTEERGTVIRLAGQKSSVTDFSFRTMGRRKIFCIYEAMDPPILSHQQPFNLTALSKLLSSSTNGPDNADNTTTIPVYWRIPSGDYGNPLWWNQMKIPKQWFFSPTTTLSEPLLILEADTTRGDGSSLALLKKDQTQRVDFELFEAAQAFHQLSKLALQEVHVHGDEIPNPKVLRVLLVDNSEAPVVSGGGRRETVDQVVRQLELAEVIIDGRRLILQSLVHWLSKQFEDTAKSSSWSKSRRRRVILETPEKAWFDSLKAELKPYGYDLVDFSDVQQNTTNEDETLPILVYGRTTADTMYSIRALQQRQQQDRPFCALLTQAPTFSVDVDYICSAQVYDAAFGYVREQTLRGRSAKSLQDALDKYSLTDGN